MHFGTLVMTGTLVGPQAGSQDNWVALSSGNFSARLAIFCTLQALQMCSQQRFACRFGHRKSNYSEAKSEMVAKGHGCQHVKKSVSCEWSEMVPSTSFHIFSGRGPGMRRNWVMPGTHAVRGYRQSAPNRTSPVPQEAWRGPALQAGLRIATTSKSFWSFKDPIHRRKLITRSQTFLILSCFTNVAQLVGFFSGHWKD